MQNADNPRRTLIARRREAEPLHELGIARAPRHRHRPRVRNVGEERADRDHELDPEAFRQVDHEPSERSPAQVGLDADHEHEVARELGQPRMVEGVFGPVDPPRQAALERHMRARRLEVEELLRVDVGEALGLPAAREVLGGERGAVRAVVPTAESGHQHG